MAETAASVLQMIKDKEIEWVDLRFTDPKGKWQHLTMVASVVDEDMLSDGFMFDGSSIDGWKAINESDMILQPDLDATYIDPFSATPMLILICDIVEPSTGQLYGRDPRSTAKRGEAYLKASGIGDTIYIGPEAEFFVFDDVRFKIGYNVGSYELDDIELPTNTGTTLRRRQHGPPPARQGRLLPRRAGRQRRRPPRRDGLDDDGNGPAVRQAPPRGRRRAARARPDLRHADDDRRPDAGVQVRRPPGRPCLWQDRDVHAQADQGRQRQRHAHPSVDLERQDAAVRRRRLCRPVGDGAVLHRRHHPPRQGVQRLHQPVDQQLQAAGPRLRGPGAARVQQPQPLGVVPHPVRHGRQVEARRGPLPRRDGQPVPRLYRAADGGPRRHREQDPPGPADGQEPVRPAAARTEEGADGVREPARGAWAASTSRARSSPRAASSPTTRSRATSS